MITNEREIRRECVAEAGRRMMTAARTAPKSKGVDIVEICMLTGDDIVRLSDTLRGELFEENEFKFFLRDADSLLQADAVVLIGTREQPMGLNCGHCGYAECGLRPAGVPCALNTVDVGIALGAACAAAADNRVDTRVMFSAGLAAQRLGWPSADCGNVLAILVSATSKNPFFDRKPKQP